MIKLIKFFIINNKTFRNTEKLYRIIIIHIRFYTQFHIMFSCCPSFEIKMTTRILYSNSCNFRKQNKIRNYYQSLDLCFRILIVVRKLKLTPHPNINTHHWPHVVYWCGVCRSKIVEKHLIIIISHSLNTSWQMLLRWRN